MPVLVDSSQFSNKVVAVSAGWSHSLALDSDGRVYAWGLNVGGELGNNSPAGAIVPSPVRVGGALAGKPVIAIAAGLSISVALDSAGQVYIWGFSPSDRRGSGGTLHLDSVPEPAPVDVGGRMVKAITTGQGHVLALASDGKLYAWGRNEEGELGDAVQGWSSDFVPVNTRLKGSQVAAIGAAGFASLFLTTNGLAYTWGYDGHGELGNGLPVLQERVPQAVAANGVLRGKKVVAVSGGPLSSHFVALAVDRPQPVIQSMLWPVAGNYAAGENLDFVVRFSAPVLVTGTTVLRLAGLAGDSLALSDASYVSGSGSAVLLFRHTISPEESAPGGISLAGFSLNGGTIRDAAGTDAPLTLTAPDLTGVLVNTGPPVIRAEPQDLSAREGANAQLAVRVAGGGSLGYQWSKDGIPLAGATSATFTRLNIQGTDGGFYQAVIANSLGAVTSRVAELVVFDSHDVAAKVSTLAGSGVAGTANGAGTNAFFSNPNGAFVDANGYVYVADVYNHIIRLVSPAGGVTTLAGSGVAGYQDGPGDQARFNFPIGVFVDRGGDIYVADSENNRIRKISPFSLRTVSTAAGSGLPGYENGPPDEAKFNFPNDLVVGSDGAIYVTEFNNHTVRKIFPGGPVITWAGNGAAGYADGLRDQSRLNRPGGIAIDGADNLYVTEWGNQRIRKIDPAGNVTTLAGTGSRGYVDGPAWEACFDSPDGIAVDTYGNVYVTEFGNPVIRRIAGGEVTTIAGGLVAGAANGYGSVARFGGTGGGPGGIGVDPQGNLVVADTTAQLIRRIALIMPPRLRAIPRVGGLELNWPATSGGFRLESTGSLGAEAEWTVVGDTVQTTGSTNRVTVPRTDPQRHYRLRRP